MEDYPSHKAYRLIEPGPVILITTQPRPAHSGGRRKRRRTSQANHDAEMGGRPVDDPDLAEEVPSPNVMTCGFHMAIQHDPPLIGVCVGPWDATFETLKSTKECVIAIPSVDLMEKAVDIGNCPGSEVNKFSKFNLTAVAAEVVKAPLIEECMANLECRVKDESMVKKYNLWVLEVVKGWKRKAGEGESESDKTHNRMFHHRGDGTFVVDGEILSLQDKMVLWKEFQD
jgi:flavin reductase (DIM6/NTAB) family NADH-FMN oxidoreductase RutF